MSHKRNCDNKPATFAELQPTIKQRGVVLLVRNAQLTNQAWFLAFIASNVLLPTCTDEVEVFEIYLCQMNVKEMSINHAP